MGHFFGNLYKLRGIVYYRISHYEQNPFKGLMTRAAPNMIRRISESIIYILPPVLTYWSVHEWAMKTNAAMSRKNPADYENDV